MLKEHSHVLTFVAAITVMAIGLAVAISDRVQVEQRLDERDDQLAEVIRDQQRVIRRLRALVLANRDAIRRLERLENPTRLDLRRLFHGLLEAATPSQVRRLVRRLEDLGIRLEGGDRDGGQGQKPPGQRGP